MLEEYKRHFQERMAFYRAHGHDREQAMRFICDQAAPVIPPVLDIGCGKGITAMEIVRHVPSVIGVDLSEEELSCARMNFCVSGCAEKVLFIRADASVLPFRDCQFKTVFMVNTLHHLPDPMTILKDAARVLAPVGRLVLADFTEEGFRIINRIHGIQGREHKRNIHSMEEVVSYVISLGLSVISRCQGCQEDIAIMRRR